MKNYTTVTLDVNNQIGTLKINRPEALNALNSKVLDELSQIIEEIENNNELRVLILTGAGEKAFVAGADIKEMKDKTSIEAQHFSQLANEVFTKLSNLRQPVIAAINGYALGGGLELALACDIRIASENAIMGQPEVGLGIIPGFGGTQRLSRAIGASKAKEYILTGKNIHADEALKVGLLSKVVEPEQLIEEATLLAKQINKNAPLAVQNAKKVIDEGLNMPLSQAIKLEGNTFGLLFSTKDQKEGMSAFIEKRKPKFKEQ